MVTRVLFRSVLGVPVRGRHDLATRLMEAVEKSCPRGTPRRVIIQEAIERLQEDYTPDVGVPKEMVERIVYSSVVHSKRMEMAPALRKATEGKLMQLMQDTTWEENKKGMLPVALKYYADEFELDSPKQTESDNDKEEEERKVVFPYAMYSDPYKQHDMLYEALDPDLDPMPDPDSDEVSSWWEMRYGVPDPNVPSSNVPCGGCGAFLHCQRTSLPGFLPRELFVGRSDKELRSSLCQRCHYMRRHRVALQVSVHPEEYPELLSRMDPHAMVLLVVDMTDFPCSLWPGVAGIIGKRPVYLIGNKVDLIAPDGHGYLSRIQAQLERHVKRLLGRNVQETCLVSARTGFGIEKLVTKIQAQYLSKGGGDMYLLGCTNVGKSSLFNAFLQSDLCKIKAVDIIRRATTSAWPGTTLNLLKFPLMRPQGWLVHLRLERIQAERETSNEAELRSDVRKDIEYPNLIGRVGLTLRPHEGQALEGRDPFAVKQKEGDMPSRRIGLNPKDFRNEMWCYDTPGSVSSEQILDLLTLEEIGKVLPSKIPRPKTITLRPNQTVFLAGLARVDFLGFGTDEPQYEKSFVRLTLFASELLPITVVACHTADELYQSAVGTSLLAVPFGGPQRMAHWPKLSGKDVQVTGVGRDTCCADLVLSSAGWMAVTAGKDLVCRFRVHTPDGRGIHVRSPALLPKAVTLSGKRIPRTPVHSPGYFFVPK